MSATHISKGTALKFVLLIGVMSFFADFAYDCGSPACRYSGAFDGQPNAAAGIAN